ncbi:hypothetical protein KQI84_16745 [bacterium]|nr:hypothetical protein [bacterium]
MNPETPIPKGRFPLVWPISFIHEIHRNWRENPLCLYLWRRVRPVALSLMLYGTIYCTICAVTSIWFFDIIETGIGLGGTLGFLFLLGITTLAVFIYLPFRYTAWARENFYGSESQILATPLSADEDILGVAIPLMLMASLLFLPGLLFGPLIVCYRAIVESSSAPEVAVRMAITLLHHLAYMAVYALYLCTFVVRAFGNLSQKERPTGIGFDQKGPGPVGVLSVALWLFLLGGFAIWMLPVVSLQGLNTEGILGIFGLSSTGSRLLGSGLTVLIMGAAFFHARIDWEYEFPYARDVLD